jgi:pimeloyl-ACP methyl ester carboxylesterase
MSIPTLPGVRAETVTTDRIRTRVLFAGPEDGVPILFLHGHASSATWWEEVMLTLPDGYRGIAPDLRGYGDAEPEKMVDATRGMAEMSDDAAALLDYLALEKAHVVGLSMGGYIAWWMLADHPERFSTATLVAPTAPYGFGGTKDVDGRPCFEDFAGSGGGMINAEAVRLVQANDRSLDNPFTMRAGLRLLVYKPPFVPERELALLDAAMAVHTGEKAWPGDKTTSANWPYVAPGKWGSANAVSPKYALAMNKLMEADPKTDILWIRGSHDVTISDNAAADAGSLGAAGFIPGWPGAEIYPPQPMIGQTRAVLEEYAAAGGQYREIVVDDAGHAPFLEQLEAFNRHLHAHIG